MTDPILMTSHEKEHEIDRLRGCCEWMEAEIARKKGLNDDLVTECIRDKAEIARLEAVNAELVEALVDLMDCQNGPPLVTWTARWNAAMARCGEAAALAKAASAPLQPRAADASTPPES